ncbi:MAG: hypothetical protein HQL39_17835, partial [Alphaproteobacteria bacterium]|nr:hypothetical protein [Alphaproteobacteria bacterium]
MRTAALALAIHAVPAPALAVAVDSESARFQEDARRLEKTGDLDGAAIQLKNAIRADRANAQARFELAQIHLRRGDPAAAVKELRAAREAGFDAGRLAVPLARAHLQAGEHAEVLAVEVPAGLDA